MAEQLSGMTDATSNVQFGTLKVQVAKLIAQHAGSRDTEPPFSVGETIIMAVVVDGSSEFKKAGVLKAIVRHFPYWNARLVERYFNAIEHEQFQDAEDWEQETTCVVPSFFEAFRQYQLPLVLCAYDRYDHSTELTYTVTESAARYFLRDRIESKRRGTFPFLRLPAELRNIIYEMVLRFPTPGLHASTRGNRPRLGSVRRMDDDDLDYGSAEELLLEFAIPQDYTDDNLEVDVSNTDLALLRVCKQIHAEAMSIFYGLNIFHVNGGGDMYYAIFKRRSPLVISSIKRIVLQFGLPSRVAETEYEHWTIICRKLSSMKLESLVLVLYDRSFLRMPGKARRKYFSRATTFTKIEQIPGFFDLAITAMNTKKFVLHKPKHCPAIKKFLDDEILRITAGSAEAEAKPKKCAKKQYKSAEWVVEDEEPKKKKKRAK